MSVISHNLNRQLDRARHEQELAVVGYAVGGSMLAAGFVLLYLNRPRLIEQDIFSTQTAGIAVVPTISDRDIGVLLTVVH